MSSDLSDKNQEIRKKNNFRKLHLQCFGHFNCKVSSETESFSSAKLTYTERFSPTVLDSYTTEQRKI